MNDLQRTEDWYEARLGRATASQFGNILTGTGKASTQVKKYMHTLIAEILTGESPEFTNSALDWGNEYETEALIAYEEMTLTEVESTGFVEYKGKNEFLKKYVGGSPDGLVKEDGIVEVKCPYNSTVHIETMLSKKVPTKYIPQVQGNLWLTGRKWCDFISYDPRVKKSEQRVVVVRMGFDPDYHKELESKLIEFSEKLDSLVKELS